MSCFSFSLIFHLFHNKLGSKQASVYLHRVQIVSIRRIIRLLNDLFCFCFLWLLFLFLYCHSYDDHSWFWSPISGRRDIGSYHNLLEFVSKCQHKQNHSSAHAPFGSIRHHVIHISGIFGTPLEFCEEMIARPISAPVHIGFGLENSEYQNAESNCKSEHGSRMTNR